MHLGRTTLSKFLIQQLNGIDGRQRPGRAARRRRGRGQGDLGDDRQRGARRLSGRDGGKNVQGETQQKLDVLANDVMHPQLRVGRAGRRHGLGGTR